MERESVKATSTRTMPRGQSCEAHGCPRCEDLPDWLITKMAVYAFDVPENLTVVEQRLYVALRKAFPDQISWDDLIAVLNDGLPPSALPYGDQRRVSTHLSRMRRKLRAFTIVGEPRVGFKLIARRGVRLPKRTLR